MFRRFHIPFAVCVAIAITAGPARAQPAGPELTRPPELIGEVAAAYPEPARRAGIEGTVVLQIDVDARGGVTDVIVLEPAGHGFDDAAVAAARQFTFRPAESDGTPVPVRITYRTRFQLTATAPPPPRAPAEPAAPLVDDTAPPRNEIVVRGRAVARDPVERTMTIDEVRRIPGTFGDTIKVVENLPGVARTGFGSGALVIWGSSPRDSRVFVDGIELPRLFHFHGVRSIVSPELVAAVDLVPGGFGAHYGDVTGGVVDVRTVSDPPDRWRARAAVDIIDASAFARGPVTDRLSILAGVRRSHLDGVLSAINGADFSVVPVYWDYELGAEYRPRAGHRLRLLALGSDDRLELATRDAAAATMFSLSDSERFHRVAGHYDAQLAPRTSLAIRAAAGIDRSRVGVDTLGLGFPLLYVDQRQTQTWLRAELEHRPAGWLTLRGGIDGKATWSRFEVEAPLIADEENPAAGGSQEMTSHDTGRAFSAIPAGYVEASVRSPGDRWSAVLGLRLSPHYRRLYAGTADEVERVDPYLEPRLSQRFRLRDDLSLVAAAGLYTRQPDGGDLSRVYGNPQLRASRALHLTTGVQWAPTEHLSVEATGFAKWLDRLPTDNADAATGEPPRTDDGAGRVLGGEILIKHAAGERFLGWLAYTLMRSERRDDASSDWYPFRWDQSHILTAVASYRLGGGWELGGRLRLVSGNPYTEVVDSYFDSRTGSYSPVFGRPFGERAPAFRQLDLKIEKLFELDGWNLRAYLDVQNVTLHENVETVQYTFDYRDKTYASAPRLLPVIGIAGEL